MNFTLFVAGCGIGTLRDIATGVEKNNNWICILI